ncbi:MULTISPECIES: inositol 2-dehydrogenase [Rhizobium]|uniref:Myo-inositol 2-dehydrogenase n=1 Tax=Rhizobium favelukesii TaxID=348824 RepID=W6RNZ1_9HYPH|nr:MULTISPECIES: inositol 2-dehydrogenase [Rhizobium]MCS0462477.1 inositol 2-dehydrogenase [Rhizobium favelukesii]UFS85346.1 inositol 2-dehydrogenase [Rhizobium sp. T136]CDM60578.1 myo-inositol 2-dehydrogenase [Rhizobium favelukesii]
MLKVGLLGAGRIGNVHAKAMTSNPGSALVAVADVNTDAAAKLAAQYGAEARSSLNIINDPAIDAVLIATSTDTHSDLIEAATKAGKAVLCEKPVDLSLERARACQIAAAATGKPVMIGFNRRFDPNFAALKTAADRGEIGKTELLSITSFDPAPPPVSYIRVSGGLFRDMMIHDFDMACWIFGGAPETVTAIGSSIVDADIGAAGDVDTAAVTLKFADGRIAVIKNSRRAVYGYDQRIELLGSEGLLAAGNILENTLTKATKDGVTGAKPEFFFLERYMRAYSIEWNAFVEAITSGSALPVSLDDGVKALAVAEAATRSLATGQTVRLADIF